MDHPYTVLPNLCKEVETIRKRERGTARLPIPFKTIPQRLSTEGRGIRLRQWECINPTRSTAYLTRDVTLSMALKSALEPWSAEASPLFCAA